MGNEFSIEVKVRDTNGTYTARYKRVQASNTSGAKQAVQQLSKKVFGKLQRIIVSRINHCEVSRTAIFKVTPDDTQKCRVCGCSWSNACSDSCYWVEDDLCNECVGDDDE
ncbi:hypothetical protein ACQ86O_17945 [Serratia sp. L9]|uniref:hypothetical protein n=1 Tax=Serratia sp. L9 TaxID=3423946 RepID=UPI003D67641A